MEIISTQKHDAAVRYIGITYERYECIFLDAM